MKTNPRAVARIRRHQRVRSKVHGTAARPRLAVYRSLHHIYAQLIDDEAGHTLASASSLDAEVRASGASLSKSEEAKVVGELIGSRALGAGIDSVVFDRGGFPYHGRVKSLAEGARSAGLQF